MGAVGFKKQELEAGLMEMGQMVEVTTDEATSRKMRAVRQKGTGPELAIRAELTALGIEFEANAPDLPGRPDMWLVSEGVAVFAHGCFWHRHEGCKLATTPKRNSEYWTAKFERNVERDARKVRELRDLGHRAIVIWQCETKDREALAKILLDRLSRIGEED